MAFNPPLLTLPKGVTWNYRKSPKFSTISQVPQSGRHPAQATLQDSTIFDIELEWDYLTAYANTTANDFEYLKAFYEAMQGSYGWFLFDPSTAGLETLSVTQDTTKLSNGFSGVQPANNWLAYSTNLNAAAWALGNIASVTGGATDPSGGATAYTILTASSVGAGAYIAQGPPGIAGVTQIGWTMTFSIWLRVPSGGPDSIAISIQDTAGFTATVCAVTTSWQRFSVSKTFTGANGGPCYIGWNGTSGIPSGITFEAAWPQLESGPTVNAYVPTGISPIPGPAIFPLWRSSSVLGGGSITQVERVQNISLLDGIYLNGTLQSGTTYTHSNLPAQVTFNSPPTAGTQVAWAGDYNYLVHFSEDTADFEEFLYQLWKMKSMKLETINL